MSKSAKPSADKIISTMSNELFTLTYGALVLDLLRDYESAEEVNNQLDKIGYNMGLRLADDLLAKNSQIGKCSNFTQVADIVAKNALKTYLGVTAYTVPVGNAGDEFAITMESNPLAEFVEIPEEWNDLRYSQVICGAVRGALAALHMEVHVVLVSDVPNPTELRMKFRRVLHESIPAGDED